MAADPSYPLYPIASITCAALLLLVLANSAVRRSWNLSVSLLCFSLFWEVLTAGINAILWADNADLKLFVYCDIVTHIQIFTSVVKPASTLLITRRLYKIADLRSVEAPTRRQLLMDRIIEYSIGIVFPIIVTAVFYYPVQGARFVVVEGFGCLNNLSISGLEILLMEVYPILLPLISVSFFCPKIIYVFYHHSRETNAFLETNGSITRRNYLRIVALGVLDILITLPFAIVVRVLRFIPTPGFPKDDIPFYPGLAWTHSNWYPSAFTYAQMKDNGAASLFTFYFGLWTSVILGFAIFGLFGITHEARRTYKRALYAGRGVLGWDVRTSSQSVSSGTIVFAGPRTTTLTTGATASAFHSRSKESELSVFEMQKKILDEGEPN